MPETVYTYNIATETANGRVNTTDLTAEILASSITIAVARIDTSGGAASQGVVTGGSMDVVMKEAITKATLDAVVAATQGNPSRPTADLVASAPAAIYSALPSSITFGTMPQRANYWTWFKPLIAYKSIVVQYEEDANTYLVYGYDVPEVLSCTIWKGSLPSSVIAGGYSQAQNDADKADFEANFKPYANRSIDAIPSRIMATAIKTVIGNSVSIAVDGSVTPVVFEYNPPTDYDIQVTAFSLLFEGTTFAFGNKFVMSALSTLSNGLFLEAKVADLAFNWQNMKRTRDLIEISEDFSLVTSTGSNNFLRVKLHLPQEMRLARDGTYAQPDYIRLTVRDNLTSFQFAEAFIQGVKL
jgi:hypothetical protein